jgi:membrane-associated phospholipid phosphatase
LWFVVGGDGAIAQVATKLVGTDVPLGVIPSGTGNLFAGNYGIPIDAKAALATIQEGARRPIDVGMAEVGGKSRAFAIACGIGFDAHVMDATSRTEKVRFGKVAYLVHALRQTAALKNVQHTVTLDGAETTIGAAQVFIANAGRMLPMLEPKPPVVPDDGLLDVIVVTAGGPVQALAAAWEATRQDELGETDSGRVFRARARSIEVRTRKPRLGRARRERGGRDACPRVGRPGRPVRAGAAMSVPDVAAPRQATGRAAPLKASRDRVDLVLDVLAVAGLVGFVILAVVLYAQITPFFDPPIRDALLQYRGWHDLWNDISEAANFPMIGIAVAIVGYLWWRHRRREAVLVGVTSVLSPPVARPSRSLSIGPGHPRARTVVPGVIYSFPSGHELEAVCILGIVALLVWRSRAPRPVAVAVAILVAVFCAWVAVARIAIDAHWPSDVLAGSWAGSPCLPWSSG